MATRGSFFRSLFMLCVSGVRVTESLGVVPGGRGMMVGLSAHVRFGDVSNTEAMLATQNVGEVLRMEETHMRGCGSGQCSGMPYDSDADGALFV